MRQENWRNMEESFALLDIASLRVSRINEFLSDEGPPITVNPDSLNSLTSEVGNIHLSIRRLARSLPDWYQRADVDLGGNVWVRGVNTTSLYESGEEYPDLYEVVVREGLMESNQHYDLLLTQTGESSTIEFTDIEPSCPPLFVLINRRNITVADMRGKNARELIVSEGLLKRAKFVLELQMWVIQQIQYKMRNKDLSTP